MIGSRAFSSMSNLTKLELPNSLKCIGARILYECDLTAVVSHLTEPFFVWPMAFESENNVASSATLYVPVGTKS